MRQTRRRPQRILCVLSRSATKYDTKLAGRFQTVLLDNSIKYVFLSPLRGQNARATPHNPPSASLVGASSGSSRFREASRKLAPFAAPPLPVEAKTLRREPWDRALILSLFLAIHKVFLRKTAFIRTWIFSESALAGLCGAALKQL